MNNTDDLKPMNEFEAGLTPRQLFEYRQNARRWRAWYGHDPCPICGFPWKDPVNIGWHVRVCYDGYLKALEEAEARPWPAPDPRIDA